MDIGPLLPGRMPNSLVVQRLQAQMQDSQVAMGLLEQQISTGQKFQLPSEDPIGAAQALQLQSLLAQNTQLDANVQTSTSLLNSTDSTMADVTNALNMAKGLAMSGIGDSSSPQQKAAMALQVQGLIQQVVNSGNTTFQGRNILGGSLNTTPPFSIDSTGAVIYSGDQQALNTYIDAGLLQPTNIDGNTAFSALTAPITSDVNPALTLQTQLSDLKGVQGVIPGQISVTLSSPATTATIDLSQAKSIGDLKDLIENALGPANVTVSINPAKNGITITPTAGTISITDVASGTAASDLGIAGPAAASIDSGDLDPALTLTTNLADLNGGTGIGPTAGNGLLITNGATTRVIDLSSDVTVEDLLNQLRNPELNLSVEINAAGNGIAITSRLNGADFSIGENNGQNATLLGIRTLTGNTLLSKLKYGDGVPVNGGQSLTITRRDGSVASIDLSGSITLQDVINKINAVDPGNLVASLSSVGNGISLLDNSGTGPLSVDGNALATALGLAGSEPGNNPAVPLAGKDVNPQTTGGVLDILVRLQKALQNNDNVALTRLNAEIDTEGSRLTSVRGQIGARLQTLQSIDSSLKNQNLQLQQSLSNARDADLAEVLSELVAQQTAFEATLRAAAQTMQLALVHFL
jgi:flagellar hook-associated protein 3 FlgL